MSARTALGLRAQRGGSVIVAVALEGGEPRVVVSAFLATAAEGDRLALEPYHVAYELARGERAPAPPAAAEAVAEGRRRQDAMAATGLEALLRRLDGEGLAPSAVALLINRAGWMSDLLAHALSAPEHPAVIEGLAVREALRLASRRHGLPVMEMDEKTLPDTAASVLGLSPEALEARLKALGASAGRPWRKEQKLASLAAWMACL